MDIIQTLAQELDKNPQHVENVVRLLDEATPSPSSPATAKELHGAMDDTAPRTLENGSSTSATRKPPRGVRRPSRSRAS